MHDRQYDKYSEMHGQQHDKYTEMHGQQNDKYIEMHGQQNFKKKFFNCQYTPSFSHLFIVVFFTEFTSPYSRLCYSDMNRKRNKSSRM